LRERNAYVSYLKELQNSKPTEQEVAASRLALEAAQKEEASAMAELLALEAERRSVDAELAALALEEQELQKEEQAFWAEHNAFTATLADLEAKKLSVETALAHDQKQLDLLQRTNIYNDIFSISHDGIFGTINGLRLGRMAAHPVDWPEINAAWGHTLLLLSTVARTVGFRFAGYDLVPMGSTSRIIKLSPGNATGGTGGRPKRYVLELYTSGDMPLGLTFMHRRFDAAMAAFLDCLSQLGSFVEKESARIANNSSSSPGSARGSVDGRKASAGVSLPYIIEGDKIGGVSIRLGMAQDDSWSSACKYVLTCCKFLLAHVSRGSLNVPR
jgi:beclin 1